MPGSLNRVFSAFPERSAVDYTSGALGEQDVGVDTSSGSLAGARCQDEPSTTNSRDQEIIISRTPSANRRGGPGSGYGPPGDRNKPHAFSAWLFV